MQQHMGNERAYAYYDKTVFLIFRSAVVRNEYAEINDAMMQNRTLTYVKYRSL